MITERLAADGVYGCLWRSRMRPKYWRCLAAADATASDVLYKVTGGWQEGEDSFTEISFFAKDSSAKLGLMFVDQRTWDDNGEAITSTNINFESVDENGNQQWISGSYTNYYSDGSLRDSGSNSRTTMAVEDLNEVPDEIDLSGYTEVVVETGVNTYRDPQGDLRTWSFTKYFETGDNAQYLGEVGVGDDGYTRIIDKNGNEFGSGNSNGDSWSGIATDSYSLELPPESWKGWALGLRGTEGADTLDLAAIAQEQGLADKGINVDTVYTRVFGEGGNDTLYGAGGMDSLRVNFEFSNFLDGRTNPSYLSNGGDFFSAHDRYVIFQKVGVPENFDKGNYILIGVGAILEQHVENSGVALKDLATSEALKITSVVNLMSGESEDMSQLPSLLSQVADKAVLLGIGDMPLGDLDGLMLKVQSVSEEGAISVEVDFIKDIDMVSLLGVLEDGSSFTADQVSINPIAFELSGDDSFPDYALGTKGRYLGTNATDKVDYSGKSVGYSFSTSGGNDELVGTDYTDIFDLDAGDKNIDGGLGNDAADINIIGMLADGHSLTVNFDSATMTYTVFDTTTTVGSDGASSISDEMLFTAVLQNDNSWRVVSTSLGKEKFNLGDATLKSVESIRVFHAIENDEPVYKSLDLIVPEEWTSIETDSYTLNLPPASWNPKGWALGLRGTSASETLDLAAIAEEQGLASQGIDVNTIYTRVFGDGGNDKLYGAGGMDSLRVDFEFSNFLDGRTNPSYLSNGGDFFSAHDRYVIFQKVGVPENFDKGNYILIGVGAILEQHVENSGVALKDLATSEALKITSVVNLMSGESEDMSQLPSLLSQVADKAVLLGIGDMLLGDLDGLMLKVQSVSEEGAISVEVDFIKDIDMVSLLGVLEDGSYFTAAQNMINVVEYTLTGNDEFSDPFSQGVRGSYQGTNASEQVDLSGEQSSVGYYFSMGDGDDKVVGTDYDDVISLAGAGTKTIDGGLGDDVADINVIGMWGEGNPSVFGLHVGFDDQTGTYTVFDNIDDQMEPMLTVSADNDTGVWTAQSTTYGKEQFDLSDASLTNVESIRIFIGIDDTNNEVVQTLDLTQSQAESWTNIDTANYSLNLPPESWGGWALGLRGTEGSDTLDLAAIAQEQGLADKGINVDTVYTRVFGEGGNDTLYGAGGMDSLRVNFEFSNFLDGRTNPSYLGSDGDFFSAHDRYVIFQKVGVPENFDKGNYILIGVGAILEQHVENSGVALKDLATSEALKITSVVNLMSGESEDMSQLPSLLSQVADKAVLLGIGDMLLGDLDGLMLKVQSVSEEGAISVEVDFIKDIDMVSLLGVLEDGSYFTAAQNMINVVEYTLTGNDEFSDPFSQGVRGSYQGTNASEQVDLSGEQSSVGYYFSMGDGDDKVVGTDYDDVISLAGAGTKTIDGGLGDDVADINVIGMWGEGNPSVFGLHVGFDDQTGTYTVFDNIDDQMEPMLTVSADNDTGVWTAQSTTYGKEQFDLSDASLTNVESIRIFIGIDDTNNEVVQTLDLTQSQAESWTNIDTANYSLNLPPESWGGWALGLRGTEGSDTLDLAAIAQEQGLADKGINVDTVYTRVFGEGGNDTLYGAGGMDSLRVHFSDSNFLDGQTNPSYLGSDGDFFSAHDRYVVFEDVADRDAWDQGNYVLLGVRAIVGQNADNAAVALSALATSDALKIDSVVNLMNGEAEDMSLLPSLLSQVAAKAVSLGIGDMLLGEFEGVMIKVQSADDQSLAVEVDFIKDIDMVSLIGVLPDGSTFTAAQNMINPVEFTLTGEDSFNDPLALGARGNYQGTNASETIDLSTAADNGAGYIIYPGMGDDSIIGTRYADVINLAEGDKNIDGGDGVDVLDITSFLDDGHSLEVNFDPATMTYTVIDRAAASDSDIFTVALLENGSWRVKSSGLTGENFRYIGDASLSNVESIRVFHAIDNNEPVFQTLDLVGVPPEQNG